MPRRPAPRPTRRRPREVPVSCSLPFHRDPSSIRGREARETWAYPAPPPRTYFRPCVLGKSSQVTGYHTRCTWATVVDHAPGRTISPELVAVLRPSIRRSALLVADGDSGWSVGEVERALAVPAEDAVDRRPGAAEHGGQVVRDGPGYARRLRRRCGRPPTSRPFVQKGRDRISWRRGATACPCWKAAEQPG